MGCVIIDREGLYADAAEKSRNYFETCAALLSDDFRQTVLRDYNEKLETLNSLKAEYEAISGEQRRREDEAEENEKRERRNRVEALVRSGSIMGIAIK